MFTITLPPFLATLEHHVHHDAPKLAPESVQDTSAGNSCTETASRITTIIERYRLLRPGQPDISSENNARFLEQITTSVSREQQIRMCLPAFPFNSPNTAPKVLGRLPDKAEEFALAHLHGMCAAIQSIYDLGAKLTIISDGLVYNGECLLPWNNITPDFPFSF